MKKGNARSNNGFNSKNQQKNGSMPEKRTEQDKGKGSMQQPKSQDQYKNGFMKPEKHMESGKGSMQERNKSMNGGKSFKQNDENKSKYFGNYTKTSGTCTGKSCDKSCRGCDSDKCRCK